MNNYSALANAGTEYTWRSRANRILRSRIAHSRTMRRAVVLRLTAGKCTDNHGFLRHVMLAWESLEVRLPRVAQTLDLHCISGYELDDVAAMLGRSLKTSVLDLRLGQAWLARAVDAQSATVNLGRDD